MQYQIVSSILNIWFYKCFEVGHLFNHMWDNENTNSCTISSRVGLLESTYKYVIIVYGAVVHLDPHSGGANYSQSVRQLGGFGFCH